MGKPEGKSIPCRGNSKSKVVAWNDLDMLKKHKSSEQVRWTVV